MTDETADHTDSVKCEDCAKEGKASKVYPPTFSFRTCMGVQSFRDKEGRHHWHDPNISCGEWRCSEGHSWTGSAITACPVADCEFNNRPLRWRGHYLAPPGKGLPA